MEKENKKHNENVKQEKHDVKKEKKEEKKVSLTKEELETLNKKASDAEEKFLRAQAELINYRKRKDEEVSKQLKYANEALILEILPALDNFERAIKMDDDNLEDEVSKFLSGMKMVYASLTATLEKFGVKEIDALGKPFDPVYHEAVMKETVDDREKGVVLEVYQKGYILIDKVIRPAMVKVNE